jgi:hypothetical protein
MRLRVAAGDATAETPLVVLYDVHPPQQDERDLLAAWATTHGGRTFQSTEIEQLRESLAAALPDTRSNVRWHWMRSPWWIVPFAVALGVEWRERRRRGKR